MAVQDPQSPPAQNSPSQNLPPLYFHHATAFGVAGQINRPTQQTIPIKASVALPTIGGHDTDRVDNYQLPGIVSFSAAYVDVGGSLDEPNDTHATYASSTIENLNLFNVITADRVVSRLTVYHPAGLKKPVPANSQPSFSIVGSHFDNLRIAGHKIEVELDTETFHNSTFSRLCENNGPARHSLMGADIDVKKLDDLSKQDPADHNCAIVKNISERFQGWDKKTKEHFWCSAVKDLVKSPPITSGMVNFGGILCVPRFGIVYLAELHVYHHHRYLTMLRVHMCSPGEGWIGGGGTGGGGTSPPP